MISLFAGALRYLGLSQPEAADMLKVSVQRVKDWASGRSRVPDGVWDDLRAFAIRRDAAVAAMRPYTIADADFMLGTLDEPPGDFPCADSYVTTLAAAVLTSSVPDDPRA